MSSKPSICVNNLCKSFKLPHERRSSLKQSILNLGKESSYENLEVLNDISFSIEKGEFFGIVGRNGSGKSTLLKTLAGIYTPTSGMVQVNGRLTPFIELGVGFNPELSGRDNVFLNGTIFGMNRREIEKKYDEIIAFAEIEKFMDQKLKNYSSGMQVRLAFSIAIQAKTEILLIDEVLAVGDAKFQQKCFKYFKELKKEGKTVIFVSHDIGSLREYCDRGILIEDGKVIIQGKIDDVVKLYLSHLNVSESKEAEKKHEGAAPNKRWGSGGIYVQDCETLDGDGNKKNLFSDNDSSINISVTYGAEADIEKPVYGITISDLEKQRIFASNTLWSDVSTHNVCKGQKIKVVWTVPNIFNNGEFTIAPAVADRSGIKVFDWYDEFILFKIRKQLNSTAYVNVVHKIEITSITALT